MKNIESTLHFLGLHSEEVKIYLSCLEFGNLPVSTISRLANIGRVNCYHHIQKLTQKGLLSESQKKGAKTFTAENPKIFINREQEKLNLAREIVPELLAIGSKNPQKPKIQFFEGVDGVKNIFEKMTESRPKEIVSFSHFEKMAEVLGEPFLKEHFQKRIQKNIKTRFISPKRDSSSLFSQKFFPKFFDERLLEIFLISPDEFSFNSEISIFSGSIAILNLSSKNSLGVLIENPELYQTQKAIFDLAWLGATSFIVQ